MKISARNRFKGIVDSVRDGAVNAEVVVSLTSGDQLVAVITQESVHSLALAPGAEVVALIKASWIMLMTEGSDLRLSARNCLNGTVKNVSPGAVNAEVTLELSRGTEVVAVVTLDAVRELGLAPGIRATAVIKASHVVLGVPA